MPNLAKRDFPKTAEAFVQSHLDLLNSKLFSNDEAVAFMREIGISVPDPKNRNFAEEHRQLEDVLGRAWKMGRSALDLTGAATLEDAVETLNLWKCEHEEVQRIKAEIAELEGQQEQANLDTVLRIAKAECRHTPAREAQVRALLASKDCTMNGAQMMVRSWGVVAAIAAGKDGASAATGGTVTGALGALTWNGLTYAQMSGGQRAKLKKENDELFNAMRDQWIEAGSPAA